MAETERVVAHSDTVVVAGIALLAVPVSAVLLGVHPLLWFVTAAVLIVGGASMDSTRTVVASDDTAKTNCPSCGSRVPENQPRCDYCNEPLPNSANYQSTLDDWASETA